MTEHRRPLVWLQGAIKSPPFTSNARIEAGFLLRRLQRGDKVGLPHVRPMPMLGARCAEVRIPDEGITWRILCRFDADAVIIVAVFAKKTQTTPKIVLSIALERLRFYDRVIKKEY